MKKTLLPALFLAFFALSFQPLANGTTSNTTQIALAQEVPPGWIKVSTWEVDGVRYTKWWTGGSYFIVGEVVVN